ncbi:unnamed protein product [Phaedon cochleariae]|uniref:Snurportin-1 n=1 Tax=Phaedon cochleariae TaxID=80249 RepID=A0A9N9X566_PHACE|nr:unnamed protein product [Phaedon cochleariae]
MELWTTEALCPLWPFSSLYKSNVNHWLSQQQRRVAHLEKQREKRHELTDNNRKQCELFIEQFEKKCMEDESMQCESPNTSNTPKNKRSKLKLMHSEWLTEIPEDLDDDWLVKFAPEGFRILLIARKHITTCYNKNGKIVLKIKTHFPGGGWSDNNGLTVLDCIYNNKIKTIYVLDCLFWNSMSTIDSEANFRFFWLKSKFDEQSELLKTEKYTFTLIHFMPAQRPLIQDNIFTSLQAEDKILYNGVVFYHKDSHYTFGYTPLVAWLSVFMLPEMLNIDIPEEYSMKTPVGYVCQQKYLAELDEKMKKRAELHAKRKKQWKRYDDNAQENLVEMETTS